MILPNKYLKISESLIGISSSILKILGSDLLTIDALWSKINKKHKKNKYLISYQKFILTLDFMYMTKMINYNNRGEIYNENIKSRDNITRKANS